MTAVVAAQAWHWFDADTTLAEAARITTGGLGTIRNDADYSDPLTEAIRTGFPTSAVPRLRAGETR
ncbi:MAG: hypothetical protein ACJ73S_09355 [Mycobacteriales bacterium]